MLMSVPCSTGSPCSSVVSTSSAAEAVGCGPDLDAWKVLDVVGRLVDKSLVQLDDDTGRYRLLDTIRQFALDRLHDDGDLVGARARHAHWYTGLVSAPRPMVSSTVTTRSRHSMPRVRT